MEGRDRLDLAWYREHYRWLSPNALLARVPEVLDIAEVRVIDHQPIPSPLLGTEQWIGLRQVVHSVLQDPTIEGVVLTHGTATLEETAYFLDLTLPHGKPVVLVGAIRPPSGLSTDADLNLLDAVRVAAASESKGKGVLVVMNDEIHSARDVTKGATLRLNAFVSRDTGPLGYIDGFGIVYYRALVRPVGPFPITGPELPRVDIAISYVGSDGTAIKALVDAGARGVVLACSAFDGRTDTEDQQIGKVIERGVAVVLSSRTGSGRVVLGPESRRRGLIGSADLLPWKARILLALVLQETRDPSEIQHHFDKS